MSERFAYPTNAVNEIILLNRAQYTALMDSATEMAVRLGDLQVANAALTKRVRELEAEAPKPEA